MRRCMPNMSRAESPHSWPPWRVDFHRPWGHRVCSSRNECPGYVLQPADNVLLYDDDVYTHSEGVAAGNKADYLRAMRQARAAIDAAAPPLNDPGCAAANAADLAQSPPKSNATATPHAAEPVRTARTEPQILQIHHRPRRIHGQLTRRARVSWRTSELLGQILNARSTHAYFAIYEQNKYYNLIKTLYIRLSISFGTSSARRHGSAAQRSVL